MYKNRLNEIMVERNISNHMLAKETQISRQTISKIKNNEFHDISVNVLTELLCYFDISFEEFGSMHSREESLQMLLLKKSFNQKNLKLLESLIRENLNVSCYYKPYSSNRCLNFKSKGYYKKFILSGNLRINTSLLGLTFEVTDLDLYKLSDAFTFEDFYKFYRKFIFQLENYASILGFTQIVINIDSYFDDNLASIIEPRYVNINDLEYLLNNSNISSYSSRENDLMKFFIIKKLNYSESFESDIQGKKDKINKYIDTLSNLDFFEKEEKRYNLLEKEEINTNHFTRKFFKVINTEIIPKDKLNSETYKRIYNNVKTSQ